MGRRREHGFWSGVAVLGSVAGRARLVGLVLVAVFAQIARNWLMLRAVGVDASVFDATAVLIAMVTLSQLPVGPSVGAAATVLILGNDGPAAAAAAGVLLTATGTVGALVYVAWAGLDRLAVARSAGSGSRPRPRRRAAQSAVGEAGLIPALAMAGPDGGGSAAAAPPGS